MGERFYGGEVEDDAVGDCAEDDGDHGERRDACVFREGVDAVDRLAGSV